MTIDSDLMYAILSIDSYNQGYDPGIAHGKKQIGTARLDKQSNINEDSDEIESGFYAATYEDDKLGTVISYRGTNFDPAAERAKDSDVRLIQEAV